MRLPRSHPVPNEYKTVTFRIDSAPPREDTLDRIRVRLDGLLKDRGFSTREELVRKTTSILESGELQRYEQLRKVYAIMK